MICILLSMQPWSDQGGGDPEGLVNGEKNVLDVVKYVEITFDESRPQKEIAHDNNIGSYQDEPKATDTALDLSRSRRFSSDTAASSAVRPPTTGLPATSPTFSYTLTNYEFPGAFIPEWHARQPSLYQDAFFWTYAALIITIVAVIVPSSELS